MAEIEEKVKINYLTTERTGRIREEIPIDDPNRHLIEAIREQTDEMRRMRR